MPSSKIYPWRMQLNLSVIAKGMLLGKDVRDTILLEAMCRVVRALGFKSAGSGSQPQALLPSGFVLGCPRFNSLGALCIWPTDLPPLIWDF